jgi:uncharacterized membrane protein YdjX (TVP38/TMEM64 family)
VNETRTERTDPGWGNLALLVGLAGMVLAAHLARTRLGIEFSIGGVQDAVGRLGLWGPPVFFALVMFRQFIALPSWLILPVGGLCFGTVAGTLLGAGALVVSGCLKFAIARHVGRDWVRRNFGERFRRVEQRVDRLGPVVVGLSTAHPFGILAPFHWGAGLSSIRFAPFALALVLGAPVRAFAFSAFGAAVADPSTPEFRAVCLGLGALVLLPLAIPAVRRKLFARA